MTGLRVQLLSAVSGGPVSRLATHLTRSTPMTVSTRSIFTTIKWREHRGAGGIRSWAARLLVLFLYPWYALAAVLSADVVIATTNPFWLPALLIATRPVHRRPVVTLVYDVYPDSLELEAGSYPLIASAMRALNHYWMRRSDGVVFIADSMRDALVSRYGEPRQSRVIATGVDVAEFQTVVHQPDLEAWIGERTLVSYIGNAGRVHDVDTVAQALNEILNAVPDDVAIFISTSGERAPILLSCLENRDQVRVEDALSDERWAWLLQRTDLAVVSLNEATPFASMPSKFFSAIGAGCAVLAVAPESTDLHRLTAHHRIGVAVSPGDVETLTAIAVELIQDTSQLAEAKSRAARLSAEQYDLTVVGHDWWKLLREVAA